MIDQEYLDFCLTFFNKIHKIQIKGTYSYSEISKVVKDIENNLDKIQYEKDTLLKYLDLFYEEMPNNDIGYAMVQLDRLRPIFHVPLKEAGQNPLKICL